MDLGVRGVRFTSLRVLRHAYTLNIMNIVQITVKMVYGDRDLTPPSIFNTDIESRDTDTGTDCRTQYIFLYHQP